MEKLIDTELQNMPPQNYVSQDHGRVGTEFVGTSSDEDHDMNIDEHHYVPSINKNTPVNQIKAINFSHMLREESPDARVNELSTSKMHSFIDAGKEPFTDAFNDIQQAGVTPVYQSQ